MKVHIVFYGPEGSGKGTQAKLISKKYGLPHLASGDLVRKYAKEDKGIMGRICRESLAKGHYVADSEMYVLWKQRLKEPDTDQGWILDGFPRNVTQARFLERKVEKYGQQLDAVIFLDVSEAESIKRLLKRKRRNPSGELHDTKERIYQRLKHYNQGKNAVLRYYKKRRILFNINGEGSIAQVHQRVVNVLEKIRHRK